MEHSRQPGSRWDRGSQLKGTVRNRANHRRIKKSRRAQIEQQRSYGELAAGRAPLTTPNSEKGSRVPFSLPLPLPLPFPLPLVAHPSSGVRASHPQHKPRTLSIQPATTPSFTNIIAMQLTMPPGDRPRTKWGNTNSKRGASDAGALPGVFALSHPPTRTVPSPFTWSSHGLPRQPNAIRRLAFACAQNVIASSASTNDSARPVR